MASIRARSNKWQARIIRKGHPTIAKTFLTRQDAEKWARSLEIEIDRGTYINKSYAEKTQFKEILQKYLNDVVPQMRSAETQAIRVRKLMKHPIAEVNMAQLSPKHLANYRDERLKVIKPNTVIRELAILSSVINHARREWGLHIENPVAMIKKPPMPQGRDRVINNEELNRLFIQLEKISTWYKPLVEFALETAMRRGELISLLWENVNFEKSVIFLPLTKNGDSRYVPLSIKAIRILKSLPRDIEGRVFPLNKGTVSILFLRAARRAQVEDFHFHDLRHMALTNLSERFPNILELAAISGHKELRMLQRYVHIKAENLVCKLG
ncbi:site-specific integrase [Candidatus Methylopumilus universalis]|uniref:tyrosine-type recombinase/integrase n=1 Tax=Candidatus Methylopumilus universalis TaxID=2588536 RepID=UPI001122F367|nr:site-specific integrase [Candidatus Methylopumilus universalis]QDC90067.1 site-specific integrase [Candidatus Methylopumilus universalis]